MSEAALKGIRLPAVTDAHIGLAFPIDDVSAYIVRSGEIETINGLHYKHPARWVREVTNGNKK
jgi:hypothetical protein